jgi:hypothetical protein
MKPQATNKKIRRSTAHSPVCEHCGCEIKMGRPAQTGLRNGYGRVELRSTKAPPFFSQRRRINVANRMPLFSENPAWENMVENPMAQRKRGIAGRRWRPMRDTA